MSDPRALHVGRLREALAEVSQFAAEGVSSWTPAFMAWRERIIQSVEVLFGKGSGYERRFQSLQFDEARSDLDPQLWGIHAGSFGEDFQSVEKILRDALEDLPVAQPATQSLSTEVERPATQDKGSKLLENAALVARYMLDNGYFHEQWISVGELMGGMKMASQDFHPADSYLMQKEYAKGTMGAEHGMRWLTAAGVDFAEANSRTSSLEKRKRGLGDINLIAEAQRMYNPQLPFVPGFQRPEPVESPKTGVERQSARRIFLVHGKDEALKATVARFLEKLKLNPIILHEQPNQGQTLIEKFEANSDVDFAVVLLTPDDMGYPSDDPSHPRPRARQNVVFELGYFFGRIGRGRVCALYKGGMEIPSDFHGVAYISLDDPQGWTVLLAREIKAAGIEVDLNLVV